MDKHPRIYNLRVQTSLALRMKEYRQENTVLALVISLGDLWTGVLLELPRFKMSDKVGYGLLHPNTNGPFLSSE